MREEDKKYTNFEREIYIFCDENAETKALFSVFTNLWDENKFLDDDKGIHKKKLMCLTERIVNDLIKKGILIKADKPEKLESPYEYYEIKRHENLIRENGFLNKKLKYLN